MVCCIFSLPELLIFHPHIFFYVQAVNAGGFYYFYAALGKGIALQGDGKAEIMTLPGAIAAVSEVFGISAILKGIGSGACRKRRVAALPFVQIVLGK